MLIVACINSLLSRSKNSGKNLAELNYNLKKEKDKQTADSYTDQYQTIAAEFPKYGYRRIYHALGRQNIVVNHKRIRRIMKKNNLLVRRKKFKPITTNSNYNFPKYQNLVQNLVPTTINQVLVADIRMCNYYKNEV